MRTTALILSEPQKHIPVAQDTRNMPFEAGPKDPPKVTNQRFVLASLFRPTFPIFEQPTDPSIQTDAPIRAT